MPVANSIRFDPFYQTDMGLHKSFALYPDGVSLDFRAEAFNILNQDQLRLSYQQLQQ